MRTCEEYEALISAFIDGALEDGDREELMAHIAHCPDCQAYFNDQIAIHDALRGLEAEAPADFTDKVMERVRRESGQMVEDEKHEECKEQEAHEKKTVTFPYWRRYAAMAACCAVVAIAGFWALNSGQSAMGNVAADAAAAPGIEDRAAVPAENQEDTAAADSSSQETADTDGVQAVGEEPALAAEQPSQEGSAAVTEEESSAETGTFSANDEETPEYGTHHSAEQVPSQSEDDAAKEESVVPSLYASAAAGETVTLTTNSQLAVTWVEENLGQDWEAGASYTLTVEQFDQVQALLEENGESFMLAMPVSEETVSDGAGDNTDVAPEAELEDVPPAENSVDTSADPSTDGEESQTAVTYVLQAAP